jgi:hypothetical protein
MNVVRVTLASAAGGQIKRERSELPRAPDCSKHRYTIAELGADVAVRILGGDDLLDLFAEICCCF